MYKMNWRKSYNAYKEQYAKYERNNTMISPLIPNVKAYKQQYKQFKDLFPKAKNIPRDLAAESKLVSQREAIDIVYEVSGEYSIKQIKKWSKKTYYYAGEEIEAKTERQSLYLTLKFTYGKVEADEAFGYVD